MPFFNYEGQRIAYTEFGGGPAEVTPGGGRGRTARSAGANTRPLILLHGLLLSQEMHVPLAKDLAARGNRVITLDLLGHGRSDRPRDMWRYSMATYGEQVVALMDHLQIDQAVVMGTSLGANAALEVAAHSPERLRGLVIEMPVLDNGLLWSALTFTPLLVALTFGEPVMKLLARATRALPRAVLPHYGNVMLDLVRQEPGPGGALLQGLFFGRIAPRRSERATFTDADARARAPARPGAPVLGRRHARQGDAQRTAARGELADGAAPASRAADRRDREVPGRGLEHTRKTLRQTAALSQTGRQARAHCQTRCALDPLLVRLEEFDFVDVDVPWGRCCAERRRRRLADPHRDERKRLG